jgi:hypothetical protein
MEKVSCYRLLLNVFDELEQEYEIIDECIKLSDWKSYVKFIKTYYPAYKLIKKDQIYIQKGCRRPEKDPEASSTITRYGIFVG